MWLIRTYGETSSRFSVFGGLESLYNRLKIIGTLRSVLNVGLRERSSSQEWLDNAKCRNYNREIEQRDR